MNEANKHWSGAFGGLRVPFEPKIILLGFLAILLLLGGVSVLSVFTQQEHLITRSLYAFSCWLGPTAQKVFQGLYGILPVAHVDQATLADAPGWKSLVAVAVWLVLIWTLFSGAISRIVALRIAKEESVGAKQALKFSWRHKYSLILPPFVVACIIGIFWGCNWLAGYLAQIIPVAGPIIFIPVFFLVLLSTLFILLLMIGIFFGFHMIPSSVATESCDGGEAFINVLTYIYSRPWSYMLYHAVMIASVIMVVWLGGVFVDVAFQSSLVSNESDIVRYIFTKDWETVRVFRKDHQEPDIYYLNRKTYEKQLVSYQSATEQERQQFPKPQYYPEVMGMKDVWAYIQNIPVESRYDEIQRVYENKEDAREHSMRLEELWRLDRFWACIAVAMFIFYIGLHSVVWGYALACLCASTTMIYFMLRKEVDGTDFDEIWEEEEEPKADKPKADKPKADKPKEEPKADKPVSDEKPAPAAEGKQEAKPEPADDASKASRSEGGTMAIPLIRRRTIEKKDKPADGEKPKFMD